MCATAAKKELWGWRPGFAADGESPFRALIAAVYPAQANSTEHTFRGRRSNQGGYTHVRIRAGAHIHSSAVAAAGARPVVTGARPALTSGRLRLGTAGR